MGQSGREKLENGSFENRSGTRDDHRDSARVTAGVNVVIQTAFLGDLLLTIPFFKSLKQAEPESPIVLVCRRGLSSLMLSLGVVDQAIEISKGDGQSYKKAKQELSRQSLKTVFCLHRSFRSQLFARSLPAEKRLAFANSWNRIFFSQTFRHRQELPEALRLLQMLTEMKPELKAKLDDYAQKYPVGALGNVPEWASMQIGSNPVKQSRSIALFPGSVWATKQWTVEGFTVVAKYFARDGWTVRLLGGPGEESLANKIHHLVPECINEVAKISLQESLQRLRETTVVVSNDSAGQHLAAVAGVPTVSIFGPTVLSLGFRPWNPKCQVVEEVDLACRPCGKHGHQVCPIGTHVCMKNISAERVISAVLKTSLI